MLFQEAEGRDPSTVDPEFQEALFHEAEFQEALFQDAEFQEALFQEAFESAALFQAAASKTWPPVGSDTT